MWREIRVIKCVCIDGDLQSVLCFYDSDCGSRSSRVDVWMDFYVVKCHGNVNISSSITCLDCLFGHAMYGVLSHVYLCEGLWTELVATVYFYASFCSCSIDVAFLHKE